MTESDSVQRRPFIYIAALRRTGSTLLSEALTAPPSSFILREPNLHGSRFRIHPGDAALLKRYGIDLERFSRTWSKAQTGPDLIRDLIFRTDWSNLLRFRFAKILRQVRSRFDGRYLEENFFLELLPAMTESFEQVGIKEVRHSEWRAFRDELPSIRWVLLARDPRDIYMSIVKRLEMGIVSWGGPFTVESVAEALMREFRHQLEIYDSQDALKVRYEDLCSDPRILEDVKEYVQSPIVGRGVIGAFNRVDIQRLHEAQVHGERITTKSIGHWRAGSREVRRNATTLLEAMDSYCTFWGYESD